MSNRTYESEMAERLGIWPHTAREFKHTKREELRMVKAALSEYRYGCDATPAHKYVDDMDKLIKLMEQEQRVDRWGR